MVRHVKFAPRGFDHALVRRLFRFLGLEFIRSAALAVVCFAPRDRSSNEQRRELTAPAGGALA
jgi:hypothetical protein